MKHLLERLNYTYHKPKHVPGKLDPQEQKAWLRYYRWLRKNKGKTAIFLVMLAIRKAMASRVMVGFTRVKRNS